MARCKGGPTNSTRADRSYSRTTGFALPLNNKRKKNNNNNNNNHNTLQPGASTRANSCSLAWKKTRFNQALNSTTRASRARMSKSFEHPCALTW
eukprot:8726715-Pyramimonas_sp.AAC.1